MLGLLQKRIWGDMDKIKLFEFYEKSYFHEIDYRDKITSRLQLPLAIYISFLSLIGFMIRNINFSCETIYLILFIVIFILSSALIAVGLIYFVHAFYGHTYEFIPTAVETEAYKQELDTTYKDYENGPELSSSYLKDYLYKYYYECSSNNSKVNDKRSENLHRANSFIVFSVAPLLLTFLVFHFGNVDKNKIDKVTVIESNKPLEITFPNYPMGVEIISDKAKDLHSDTKDMKGGSSTMTDEKNKKEPPPPPPPPPKRVIREDIQIGEKLKRDKKGGNE